MIQYKQNVTVEQGRSGVIAVSALINNHLVTEKYIGYTKQQAISKFKIKHFKS
jgi:hypothetical protein